MIANYGGGGSMKAADYLDSDPVHHPVKSFGGNRHLSSLEENSSSCYDMATHACECIAEKCGAELCGAAGGQWSDQCPGTCDCKPSSVPAGNKPTDETGSDGDGSIHGHHGQGVGGGHGNGDGSGHGHHGQGTGGGHGNGDGSGHWHHDGGDGSGGGHNKATKKGSRPDFGDDAAGHARWLVAKSLWTTISTVSSKEEGAPFGNIRSVADGVCFLGSSGLPYFYVPSPDPTAIDIKENNRISLSFTEAALSERVGEDGIPCGGSDAEDPTCAKISLNGHAIPLDDDQIELAKASFKAQHPRASWLANGGAHTGGSYYTLHLHSIMFLRTYGGFAKLSTDEYLNWKPVLSKFHGEEHCETEGHGLEDVQQAQSTSVSNASSFSFLTIMVVLFASFLGSFIGGIFSEKYNAYRRRNNRYVVAQGEDHTLKVTDAESC